MKKLAYLCIAVMMILAAGGCGRRADNTARKNARDLYLKSSKLLRAYADSMEAAKDSATLLALEARLNDSMTRLNFEYPTETDLEISEGENDTLVNLTSRCVLLRDSMLYVYAHPAMETDSLAADDGAQPDNLKSLSDKI